jgi:fructose-1,6-bisphosphatase/inositol monophosphatase family enzyme
MHEGRPSVDVDAVVALVRDVAARVHVPLFRRGVDVEEKAPGEVVSRVDREAERLLTEGLAELSPGTVVVGEESAAADPSLLRALRGDDAVWLVDPLDGTAAFLNGSPDHAVMVALVRGGRTLAAVVHQPQHGRTYAAEQGAGSRRDGVRLRREAADPEDLARLRGGVLRRFLDDETRRAVEAAEAGFGDLTPATTCAGVEYPRIVEGGVDFLLFWRTLPWDHAPGALLLTEAGGAALRPDGSPYRPDDDRVGLLAAADARTARAVTTALGLDAVATVRP